MKNCRGKKIVGRKRKKKEEEEGVGGREGRDGRDGRGGGKKEQTKKK